MFCVHALSQLEDDVDVQSDFVIPDSELYPLWLQGLELGRMADICRQQQNLLFKKFPNRAEILDDYDFRWWIPPTQPSGTGTLAPWQLVTFVHLHSCVVAYV